MKRVIVIGCPGSGKTTFAEKLSQRTKLPLYYLDAIWHKPDRTHITREDFDERMAQILPQERWILDGNYGRTVEMRLRACDTVFLFDLPAEVCLAGRGMLIDASYGHKTKTVLLMDTDHVILSAIAPETLSARWTEQCEEGERA